MIEQTHNTVQLDDLIWRNNKIEVLDAIMGSGKSVGILKWMLDNPNNKYLYISPMLTEVEERVPQVCAALGFVFPNTENHRTKSEHLLELLKNENNISFTHELFKDLSNKHLKEIRRVGYTLIIDEEIGMIEPYSGKYKKGDIVSLEKAKHIRVDEDNLGKVEWLWEDMEDQTQYSDLKRLCSVNMLYCSKRHRDMMVIQLPISLIESSKRTILLTYMFKGSVMESFLKLRGVEIVDFTEVELIRSTEDILKEAKARINICSTQSTDAVANLGMSSTWYSTLATKGQLDRIGAAIRSVCRKVKLDGGNPTESILLTLPKDSTQRLLKKRNNARCVIPRNLHRVDEMFLYCGARATNDYAEKDVVIHAYNRYINTVVKAYLQDYGAEVGAIPDDDLFALSEMVQWIWRSRIRKNTDESIDVYILPKRMRVLFEKWLEGELPKQD